ncbi:MAG TPA: OsmC family protein [Candidatus Thermoplasmatota archaeon]|nr:OsmC family protein [Candidatus Thermoplasmatota archaeon]
MELVVRNLDPERDAMECVAPSGAVMTFDNPPEGRHGASPLEHLLASLGACALVDVGIVLRKKRLSFRNLRVTCTGERREKPYPRSFTSLKLRFEVEGDVPSAAFEEAVRLSVDKYCSVAGTIREAAPVAWEAAVTAPR